MKKYQPSNGTEGDFFMQDFCYRCKHYDPDACLGSGDCTKIDDTGMSILCKTVWMDVKEEGYPEEWQYGEDGLPRCTAFEVKS